jgi:predicted TIM-barrel fold metal-dependent hydrolase
MERGSGYKNAVAKSTVDYSHGTSRTGCYSAADREKIAHGNAERLLRI